MLLKVNEYESGFFNGEDNLIRVGNKFNVKVETKDHKKCSHDAAIKCNYDFGFCLGRNKG